MAPSRRVGRLCRCWRGGGRPENGFFYDSTGEIVTSFLVGLLVAFFFLGVVGTVGYLIARLRKSDGTWAAVTFGRSAMVITAGLLVVTAAGRAAQDQEEIDAAKPDPSGSMVERQKAALEARQWSELREPIINELQAALAENQEFMTRSGHRETRQRCDAKRQEFETDSLTAESVGRGYPPLPWRISERSMKTWPRQSRLLPTRSRTMWLG